MILPYEIFGNGYPLVQFELTVVAQGHVLVIRIFQYTLVLVESERKTVGVVFCTDIQSHIVTLVECSAENFIHPVGTSSTYPWVLAGIPTCRQSQACIGIRKLTHLYLFLRIQRFNQVGSLTQAESSIIAQRRSTFLRLLGSHEDYTTGTRLCTIDSSRSGVLQYHDGLDIVHGSNRSTRYTVHYPKYVIAIL